jgi:hypothetical protein
VRSTDGWTRSWPRYWPVPWSQACTAAGTAIRITVDQVAIHVVARYPAVMDQVAGQIRRAVAPLAPGLRVDVAIEDLAVPGRTIAANAARNHRRITAAIEEPEEIDP